MLPHIKVKAFPVPIINNEFILELRAFADVSFQYNVLNSSGNIIFTRHYTIENGYDLIDDIQLPSQTEKGILFNVLTFKDRSETRFQKIK